MGGFVIRNSEGVCVFGAGIYFGRVSPLEAEVKALGAGLDFCISMGLSNLDIESDSMVVKHLLKSRTRHWKIERDIIRISENIRATRSNFEHMYREINSAADYLANIAVDIKGDFSISSLFMPLRLRAILLLDNSYPYIRV